MQHHHSNGGFTLLEALIAILVLSIGLLGALAVIPFGVYQVSQANTALYTANMLANAEHQLRIRQLASPLTWKTSDNKVTVYDDTGTKILNDAVYDTATVNCEKIALVSMHTKEGDSGWKEIFRGQDDYTYEVDKDSMRNGAPVMPSASTGKYTWFFTYRLSDAVNEKHTADSLTSVPLEMLTKPVTVDLLGCYNRIESDDLAPIAVLAVSAAADGKTITIAFDTATYPRDHIFEKLERTKYVLFTWDDTPARNGTWCKLLFLDKKNGKMIVSAEGTPIPDITNKNPMIRIKSGVVYHKRIENVRLDTQ